VARRTQCDVTEGAQGRDPAMPDPLEITRDFGREAFGEDPDNYDTARPPYPDWIFETLATRCGLGPGCAAFEAGAGTGIATRRLLAAGASVVAIEPDARLAAWLAERAAGPKLKVVNATFEAALLEDAAFDLGACATAFHWLDEDAALAKIARALKPGGWWAMWWNVYAAIDLPDPFHEATKDLLGGGPVQLANGVGGRPPYALDVEARQAAVERAGAFEDFRHEQSVWSVEFDPDQIVRLYASYSDMAIRLPDDRGRVLAELHRIATEDFAGRVTRNITTILYTARRRG